MSRMGNGNSVAGAMVLKTLERYSVLGVQLIVQIVIARILDPSEYGIVSMMTVFINIATVFVQNGFSMALVQKLNADENDYSTALVINFLIGCTMYAILFFSSPFIAAYYSQPAIEGCLRVLGLSLVIGSVTAIQNAIAMRNMRFNLIMASNLSGSVISGAVGIGLACAGLGVWALIVQQLSSSVIITLAFLIQQRWKFHPVINRTSAKSMFQYGWKLLAAGLVNVVYNEMNSLVIGRKYTSSDLAFYNKGKQFPSLLTTGIDSSIQTVMLSVLSKEQRHIEEIRRKTMKCIVVNTYIVFPLMMGMALAGQSMTCVLLTEKWLPIVPYLQICCFTFAFHPIASIHLQGIAAIGRSDVRLKLEFIKKPIGIVLLLLVYKQGPMAIAISAAITSVLGLIISIIAGKIYVGIPVWEQIRRTLPTTYITLIMGAAVFAVGQLPLSAFLLFPAQTLVGVGVYVLLSHLTKNEGYQVLFPKIREKIPCFNKKKKG